jgi:putative thiamine transport system permease protein
MLRFAPPFAVLVLAGPIFCGLLATLLPAFGYFPALGGHHVTLIHFASFFAEPGIWISISLSLATGLVTTGISLGLVMLFFAAWSRTKLFIRVQHLVSPLLSIPHAAVAFGLAFMIAPSGWIMRLISPELTGFTRPPDWQIINDPMGLTMMAGLVIKEIPFLFLVCLAAMGQVRSVEHSKVATSLGYGRMAGFLFTSWPLIYRQVRLAVFAVIAYASSVVDVALILGPTNPEPLAVRLIGWLNDPDLTFRFQASAGAIVQFLLTGFALLVWLGAERLAKILFENRVSKGARVQKDKLARYLSGFSLMLIALMIFIGMTILGIWSFAAYWSFPDALPRGFTLNHWQRQLAAVGMPFRVTLILGLISTLIAIAIALACLEREARTGKTGGYRSLQLLYLPLIIPQPAFLFGLQMLFLSIGINTSFSALVIVHLVFVLPYVFLSLSDPWRAYDKRYSWAAASMGIGENRVFWRIRMPLLLRPILVAMAIGFAVSIGQYLPTVLIGAGRWPTLTTEAVALASGGDRRVIGVYAFLQMLLPFLGFVCAAAIPAFVFAGRKGMKGGA